MPESLLVRCICVRGNLFYYSETPTGPNGGFLTYPMLYRVQTQAIVVPDRLGANITSIHMLTLLSDVPIHENDIIFTCDVDERDPIINAIAAFVGGGSRITPPPAGSRITH